MLPFFKKTAPLRDAPVLPPANAFQAPAEPAHTSNTTSIRETIDLLELDLSAMIREVEQAATSFHGGVSASTEALAAIRASTETLGTSCDFARAAVLNLTGQILRWLGPSAVRTPSA